ncbi:MBL fold metallo-hydrolase [Peribacillus tepidiphilus]|uniref:MBL fold metallo-hydrolase n=1 Tax=Peribacillus tepidiphilus TaxID=2652445 RepID=UPI0012921AC2|nr:MBL fold metallo-hydrolase [Peribacillus tepidiphilus]
MEWKQIPLGPLQTNCYILWNEKRECIIFDPGDQPERIKKFVKENNLVPIAVLLTHAHFDHIGALDSIRDEFKIEAYLHQKEASWLSDPSQNLSQLFMPNKQIIQRKAENHLKEEGSLKIGSFSFQVLETPGHSPGSVSFYHQESSTVFSGDALFQGSIGRTDLPKGNQAELIESIHTKLLTLPEETIVLPGHGPVTTVGQEMDHNPFLNGF